MSHSSRRSTATPNALAGLTSLLKFSSPANFGAGSPVSPESQGSEQGTAAASLDEDHSDKEKPTVASPPPADGPPDGGWDAWLTIAGAWMVQFCTFGYVNAFGVYQDYYTRQFLINRTASDISWIGSVQLFMQYAPGIFVGKAFDHGYFHQIMILGSIIYVFSMFMVSLAQPGQYYQVFLSQAVGMGIGQGMLFLPSLSIVPHHFKRYRALAIGVVVSGASCGGIVFPIMLNTLSELGISETYTRQMAFANAVRITAGTTGLLLLVANLIMKTRGVPISLLGTPAGIRKSLHEREMAATARKLAKMNTNINAGNRCRPISVVAPDFVVDKRMSALEQRISYLEDRLSVAEHGGPAIPDALNEEIENGGDNTESETVVSSPRFADVCIPNQDSMSVTRPEGTDAEELDAVPRPRPRPRPRTAATSSARPDMRKILTDTAYLLSMAAAFCINVGIFFPYFYIQLYAVENGVDPKVAFYALTVLNASSCLGRVVPNFLADRLGIYNNICIALITSTILLFGMLAVNTWVGVIIFVILYGFSSGAYVALIPSLLGQLSHLGELGIRMGIAFSVVAAAMLIGTPVAGALLDQESGKFVWWRAIAFSGIMVTCGAILMTASRFVYIKNRKTGQLV